MPKKSSKSKKETNDEIVISLDQFAVPGAIILAGILIAVAVFLTNRDNTASVDTGDTDNIVTEQPDDGSQDAFQEASTDMGDAPYIGDKDKAKVAIVEFNEYNCSYCLRHKDETLPDLIENYVDTGEIIYVFRDFAIYGDSAANAAKCVYHLTDVEKYKEFHEGAFNYEDDDDLYALAKEVGVNEAEFDSCYSSKKYQDEVDADMKAGQDAGVQGTPGFVVGVIEGDQVNGVLVPGAYPFEEFESILQGYLSE